jgi:uracil-DNA glycosylase
MNLRQQFGEEWYKLLEPYLKSDEFKDIGRFIRERRGGFNNYVYPAQEDIFKSFKLCPLESLKCVVVGYEPYGLKCDNGLSFGYNGDGPLPPALNSIHKMYEREIWNGLDLMFDYSLEDFAKKGMLMLNLSLTKDHTPDHINVWKGFMMFLLKQLNTTNKDLEYFFWDKRALVAKSLLTNKVTKGVPSKPFAEIELLTDIKFR